MVWTKLIIVVEINRVPDHLLSWVRDPRRRRFWNRLWMCRGAVLVFLVGLMDRKRKPIVGGVFATAKESWSQLGTSYRNGDICLLLMTETIATARKIVSSQLGKRIRTKATLECWGRCAPNLQSEVFPHGSINLLFRAGWMFWEETSWNIGPRGSC